MIKGALFLPKKIKLNKNSEFFISIAKKGIHSFMMLGVVAPDGTNHLLARVGKSNDIDPDYGQTAKKVIVMAGKAIVSYTQARLADEGIARYTGSDKISYQAYSINYNQAVDFLHLIREIEVKQTPNNPHDTRAITALIPVMEKGDDVFFEHKHLCDLKSRDKPNGQAEHLAQQVSTITAGNTCRTSALNMVEAILGFATKVSKFFFVSPKYKTTLDLGLPNKDSFYILPPPPKTYDTLPASQQKVLMNLYKQMEAIPEKNPNSLETRNKFNAVKDLYKKIAGENKLNANELLVKIIDHEAKNEQALHAKRNPGFLSQLLGLKSDTEKTFGKIKRELQSLKACIKSDKAPEQSETLEQEENIGSASQKK
jgi:hypothetical protein